MTKEDAERRIQELLGEMQRIFDKEIRPLADEFKVEFSWMGSTMRYHDWYRGKQKRLADVGFFVSDNEWHGSGLGCENDEFYEWRRKGWPEDYKEEEEP